ncbi:DUF3047 domain-containing protein [Rhodobacteraceae bacterium SC52]|nr:DUF3047 domain-containing protein [Rhodobacteraceae bacterium SC52]
MHRFLPVATLALMTALTALPAAAVDFTGWTEQKFSLFSSNDYRQAGSSLGVKSDGSVSLLWTRLPEAEWGATSASWRWSVDQSVPPTPLDQKGGDDRNLSLYFVFLPETVAAQYKDSNIRKLLEADEARVLLYVWGGDTARGTILPSPYLGARGKTVVLRGAGTGAFAESVNLQTDLSRAFGSGTDGVLVGLAVSADSDDTDSVISGGIANLTLK